MNSNQNCTDNEFINSFLYSINIWLLSKMRMVFIGNWKFVNKWNKKRSDENAKNVSLEKIDEIIERKYQLPKTDQ